MPLPAFAVLLAALLCAPTFALAEPESGQAASSSEQSAAPAPAGEGAGCMPGGGCCGSCGAANPTTGEPSKLGCPCQRRKKLLEEQRRREAERRQNGR